MPDNSTTRDSKQKTYGVVVAVVTDNVDPDGGYKVKVKYPTQHNMADESSHWVDVMTIGGSDDGGIFWLPEVDDSVLIAFEHGDFNAPYVIGGLWNSKKKAIYKNKDADGKVKWASFQGKVEAKKNDIRGLTTRKFHQLLFNDNASEPRVALHSSQKHRIVLDDKDNQPTQIEIYDGKEENYILIDTKNKKITMESKTGDILIKASKTITLDCDKLETKSKSTTNMDVGSNFEMKAKSNMTLKANGQGDIESSGTMTIKGATVNIN